MKKSILCLMLVLCLCLGMILASCKPDEPAPEPPAVDDGGKQGQVHQTPDTSAGVDPDMPNPQLDGSTIRQ